MKNLTYILIVLMLGGSGVYQQATAQKSKRVTHKKTAPKRKNFRDSIVLANIVEFDKTPISVTHNNPNYVNIVKFTLRITNNSKVAIPDPVAFKAQYIKFYINGQLNNPKTIYDEDHDATAADNAIDPGTTQTFYCDWLSTTRASLQKKYGKKYTVQWVYLNIRSKKVAVDVVKRTARVVN